MNELTLRTETIPAAITANFEEVRKALAERLEKYDVVVTADGVKDAKSLATELNKMAGELDKRRKEEVAKASAPVREFDDRMKDLVAMCKEGRQKLIQQVERYEDETRKRCHELLRDMRQSMMEKHGVRPEFQTAVIDDLVLISNVTATGNLTAKARNTLASRVQEDKALQDQTERRLMALENSSYKAGLAAPLTKDHVHRFLFEPDEVYQAELDRLLDAEVKRQEEAERRQMERIRREEEKKAREKMEAEQREREEAERKAREADRQSDAGWERIRQKEDERRRKQDERATNAEDPLPMDRPPTGTEQVEAMRRLVEPAQPTPDADGMVSWEVTAVFVTRVKATISQSAIEAELRRVMGQAGITALDRVTARAVRDNNQTSENQHEDE